MMTDPIADMLTRIRNASTAHKAEVTMPFSKLKFAIATILAREGYLSSVTNAGRDLQVTLAYKGRQSTIHSLDRISKPGHRTYCKAEELPIVVNHYGLAIISTSQGLMTNKEAKKAGLGGEVLCFGS